MSRFVWATPGPYDDDTGTAHAVEAVEPAGIFPFITRRINVAPDASTPAVLHNGVPSLCGFSDEWAWANATRHTKRCEACQALLAPILAKEEAERTARPEEGGP